MSIETKIKGNFVPASEFFKQIFKEEEGNYFKNYVDAKKFIKRIFEEERLNYLKTQKTQDDINNK